MGVPPVVPINHPCYLNIFHYKPLNHPLWGIPIYGHPHVPTNETYAAYAHWIETAARPQHQDKLWLKLLRRTITGALRNVLFMLLQQYSGRT